MKLLVVSIISIQAMTTEPGEACPGKFSDSNYKLYFISYLIASFVSFNEKMMKIQRLQQAF